MCACMRVCASVCVGVYACACECVCVSACASVCVCLIKNNTESSISSVPSGKSAATATS